MTLFQPSPNQKKSEFIYETGITGLWFLAHKKFSDDRGFYAELSRIPEVEEVFGAPFKTQQLNLSYSETNVVRGFHAEQWNKLITAITGTCFCVLADIRPDSTTFGKTEQFLLGDGQDCLEGSLFVTAGIANSVCVLNGPANYLYAVDQLYSQRDPSGDVAISLFDQDLAVDWPISREQMILSDRDTAAISLREKYPKAFNNES